MNPAANADPPGLRQLIAACPGGSVLRWLWFQFARTTCLIWFKIFYRLRITGGSNMPRTGPVLVIANHQSFLDPILIGMATGKRPAHMLARKNLFKPFFIGWLLKSLNGVPVDRGTADLASMRRCIDILKQGQALSLFPEGTRTEDGRVLPFKPGMLLIARRAQATLVPMAIAGSFEAWPRSRKLPHLTGRIRVQLGEPVTLDELSNMTDDAILAHLGAMVRAMKEELEK